MSPVKEASVVKKSKVTVRHIPTRLRMDGEYVDIKSPPEHQIESASEQQSNEQQTIEQDNHQAAELIARLAAETQKQEKLHALKQAQEQAKVKKTMKRVEEKSLKQSQYLPAPEQTPAFIKQTIQRQVPDLEILKQKRIEHGIDPPPQQELPPLAQFIAQNRAYLMIAGSMIGGWLVYRYMWSAKSSASGSVASIPLTPHAKETLTKVAKAAKENKEVIKKTAKKAMETVIAAAPAVGASIQQEIATMMTEIAK
jgi:hypothetical protein